jgi:hypothetical protein
MEVAHFIVASTCSFRCMHQAGWVVVPVLVTEFFATMGSEDSDSLPDESKMQSILVEYLENLTSTAIGEFEARNSPEAA